MSSDASTADPIWHSLLASLYGEEEAMRASSEFTSLLSRHETGSTMTTWDHTDAWLITYPDQFRRPGESALATLRDFYLTNLADVFTGVHVLPFFPWSSDDGFAIVDYLRVDERYGSWTDIASLANETRLMVDAVVNHLSTESPWFTAWLADEPDHEGLFRTAEPSTDLKRVIRAREHPLLTRFESASGSRWVWTTFSPDQVDLDYREPRTLLRILEVLLEYAARGADLIRLDAVGFVWKEESTPSLNLPQTHQIVRFFRACLDVTYPHVLLITETNVPHTENISYLGGGRYREAQAVYQFPLPPLVLHSFTTGDAGALREWVSSLAPPPSGTTYLNMLATHDGVGLRPVEGILDDAAVDRLVGVARESGGRVRYRHVGEDRSTPYELNATWFDLIRGSEESEDALTRHLASHAVLLGLQGVPAIYAHSLFATRNDIDSVCLSGEARSINRSKFRDVAILEAELDNRSSEAGRALRGIKEMLRWRRSSRAFSPAANQRLLDTPNEIIGIERSGTDGSVARVYVNTSAEPVSVDIVSNTETSNTETQGWRWSDQGSRIELGPWGSVWML